MKPIVMAAALVTLAAPAAAEPAYDPSFYIQLSELGLEREAFLYAFRWAVDGITEAEIEVAYALLDGIGVEENPMAAIVIACRSDDIREFELAKIMMKANLRFVAQPDSVAQIG